MSDEMKPFPVTYPEVVEIDGEAYLVDKDGNVLERLVGADECIECGDTGPWVDECTNLCEMCSEWIMGPDDFGDEEDEEF